jgi:hypothetical protein
MLIAGSFIHTDPSFILQRFTWQKLVHSLDLIRLHTNLHCSTAGSQGAPINHNLFPMSILHVQKFVIPIVENPVQRFCKLMYFKRTIRRRLIKMYAIIDDQSNRSLASPTFFDMFNILDKPENYTLSQNLCTGFSTVGITNFCTWRIDIGNRLWFIGASWLPAVLLWRLVWRRIRSRLWTSFCHVKRCSMVFETWWKSKFARLMHYPQNETLTRWM